MHARMGSTKVSPAEIINVADDDDDDVSLLYTTTTKLRNIGKNPNNAISVEQYSSDRDLHLAVMASLLRKTPQPNKNNKRRRFIDDDDVQVLESSPSSFRKPFRGHFERGESSNSKSKPEPDEPKTFMCEICVETKPYTESFSIKGCTHFYCSDCMIKYVASKLQDNITQIRCPVEHCKGLLEPEHCRSILPVEVFDRWGSSLCEAVILASQKFYCPYKDCSALMIDDGGEEVITESECPNCRRLFCAQCKVPWHSGIGCPEFQKLGENEREREDIMLMQLAKARAWKRCPMCKIFVAKSYGCDLIRCRCGHGFCYRCGSPQKSHNVAKCVIGEERMSWLRNPANLSIVRRRASQYMNAETRCKLVLLEEGGPG